MASGDDGEHRMLFDIRGRRRNVVKVVYATLAILMGLSLFLVMGGFNIGELVSSGTSTDAAGQFEDDAERIERRLVKEPDNPNLLLGLTRARVNAANSQYDVGPAEERVITTEATQQLRLAADAWNKYLKATDEPASGGAQLMAPNFIALAEFARTVPEAESHVESAAEAQQIVADQRPSLNSLSTLAFYLAILGQTEKADKAVEEANKFTNAKSEREAIDKELARFTKIGQQFDKQTREAEEAQAQAGGGAPGLEEGGLSGLGGAGLGE
jgi:hypothetical protein